MLFLYDVNRSFIFIRNQIKDSKVLKNREIRTLLKEEAFKNEQKRL
jgi:hypothetical protein